LDCENEAAGERLAMRCGSLIGVSVLQGEHGLLRRCVFVEIEVAIDVDGLGPTGDEKQAKRREETAEAKHTPHHAGSTQDL
jgi:hypothetical protein